MGALLQLIGEPPDHQIATEAQRRSSTMQSPPGTPQLLCRSVGWQRHTVRGVFSGTLKKELGLILASAKEERGRVYRIAEPAGL
jgi:hypothetical protein